MVHKKQPQNVTCADLSCCRRLCCAPAFLLLPTTLPCCRRPAMTSQVLWSYGRRGNDDFFCYHGFVLGQNPDEDVVLFADVAELVGWALQELSQEVQELLGLRGQPQQQLLALAGGCLGGEHATVGVSGVSGVSGGSAAVGAAGAAAAAAAGVGRWVGRWHRGAWGAGWVMCWGFINQLGNSRAVREKQTCVERDGIHGVESMTLLSCGCAVTSVLLAVPVCACV
jgi:hypothetical protein